MSLYLRIKIIDYYIWCYKQQLSKAQEKLEKIRTDRQELEIKITELNQIK